MADLREFQQSFLERLDNQLHLTELFDYLPEVYFYAKDNQSRFVKANKASVAMHGCTSELQMIGKSDHDFHPRHLAEQYISEDQRVMKARQPIPNQVWLVPVHDGTLKWFVSTKIPLFGDGGQVIGIAGAMRDFEKAESLVQPYQQMEQVLAFVVQHYAEKIEVKQLASLVHLSVSQFDRRFKSIFQMTPQKYVLRVRINAACQALTTTNQSVANIAQSTGFYDQSYFTKQFRRHMGLTPLAYRRKYADQDQIE
ncbi:AraC family transcriptional regulator [Thalassoroseus pseudoceratinae]|uniref:AraC family transcriptional regulator n=1 Tax=Thalassoroseus pseudoceratinae TaxID=2713176 RepID=UPI001423E4A8|nr:AraC family transcriptional regulator [Thalassoroseus pseudoceratinae]